MKYTLKKTLLAAAVAGVLLTSVCLGGCQSQEPTGEPEPSNPQQAVETGGIELPDMPIS